MAPRANRSAAPVQPEHYLSIGDLSRDATLQLLDAAEALKQDTRSGIRSQVLVGRCAALLFQKPSLRTRVSFDVGMRQLGGDALYLSPPEVQLGQREDVADVGRVLSRYVDGIVARVYLHEDLERLAAYSTVPVINALSDVEHPCQALADLLTLRERFSADLQGLVLVYVGDGNNVAHSLALACAYAGIEARFACPEGYEPSAEILERARQAGGKVCVLRDAREAARGAHVVYTDAWYSMGQESEAETRRPVFRSYQVNRELLREMEPDAVVLHCLPAHRGQEISEEVLDSPASAVWDQAENRLHAQKALLARLIGPRGA